MPRSRLAALLAALALLAPASAFAQSAGDEQYQDPFGGDDQQQSSSGDQGSSSGSAGTTAQATPTPAPVPTAAPTATAAQQSVPAAVQQLPRTGGDPVTPAVAGFWLVLGGVALRARLRLHDRRA
jgi:hypothetical protein